VDFFDKEKPGDDHRPFFNDGDDGNAALLAHIGEGLDLAPDRVARDLDPLGLKRDRVQLGRFFGHDTDPDTARLVPFDGNAGLFFRDGQDIITDRMALDRRLAILKVRGASGIFVAIWA